MNAPQTFHLQVLSELEELTQVLAWFDQFNQPCLPLEVWLQCQLALAEGFTNAVRHAHKNQPTATPIEIAVTQSDCSLEIRIWDHGCGFDLNQTLQQMPQTVTHEAAGGRGLKLISQLADQVTYTRTADRRNCLLIVKTYRFA